MGPMGDRPATDCPCRCHRIINPEDYLCHCRFCWED
jgi:hypothetical protein